LSIRAAASSPMIVSFTGSHAILRPVRTAMSERWLMKSDWHAVSIGLAGSWRLLTHSRKSRL
jgi:hypothetical protein